MSQGMVFQSFVDVLRYRAATQPALKVLSFVEPRAGETSLTFAELDHAVRSVAAGIQAAAKPGDRVILLLPPGLDYVVSFLACLAAGVIAVPAYPPSRSKRSNGVDRLVSIGKNAGASVVLSSTAIIAMATVAKLMTPELRGLKWLSCEKLMKDAGAKNWREPDLSPDSTAFLQYTSGSTGDPKGVIVSHGNLLHNSRLIEAAFGSSKASQGVIWLPPYHDMGLIGGILQPLYVGFPCALMSPITFVGNPAAWLQEISKRRATISGGPNFAYELCVTGVDDKHLDGLDLSAWNLAFTGAEPIRQPTLARFAARFGRCGFKTEAFYPCYGLAEATLIVTGAPPADRVHQLMVDGDRLEEHQVKAAGPQTARPFPLVASGGALAGVEVRLVEPESRAPIAGDDAVGEIWVRGDSVAKGYWGQAALTAATFAATVAGSDGPGYLRTGDLGFLRQGQLFVTGRLKDLIIVNGKNHYPQDIELTAQEADSRLRPGCGAAFAVDRGAGEAVVVVFELAAEAKLEELTEVRERVLQAVSGVHGLALSELVLVPPRRIPKTTSGKVRRQSCKAAYLKGDFAA